MRWLLLPILAALFLTSGCSPSGPRVIVRNDVAQARHLFYCANYACTTGVGGNDVVLQPGKEAHGYWNSPDSTGLIGVATSPGNRLLGCLANPSQGQDDPPTRTLLTSRVRPCPGQMPGKQPAIRIVDP